MVKSISHDRAGSPSTATRPLHPPIEKMFAMGKGDAEDSYSQNSSLQAHGVSVFALPHLNRGLESVNLSSTGPIVVADLGCSSGPNTIDHVSFIVGKLSTKAMSADDVASSPQVPEFHVFLSDLPSNDFNTLFQLLAKDPRACPGSGSKFFAAGVPGSFYGRLFCRSSVHVFFSASALHWLSKVPDTLLDKESPAFNKGTIFIENSAPEVGKAYAKQAIADMKNFLLARAAELAPGGLLFFFFAGRNSDDLHDELSLKLWEYVDDIWTALIEEGVLTEEQRDNLNIPMYRRTRKEMEQAIQSVESFFDVVLYTLNSRPVNFFAVWPNSTPSQLIRNITGFIRAVLGGLIEAHIGKEASEIVWQRYEERIRKESVPQILRNPDLGCAYHHIVALVRK